MKFDTRKDILPDCACRRNVFVPYLHYKNGRVKLTIGLAKGKKQHDKQATERDKEWRRDQQRLLRVKS